VRGRAWSLALALALGLQALAFVAPGVEPRLGFGIGFALVSGLVLATAWSAPLLPARWALAFVFPVAGLVVLGVAGVRPGDLFAGMATLLCLLAGGTLAGAAIGGRIQDAGHLAVVAYVSSLADLYSVLTPSGLSAEIASDERVLAVVALPWPMMGFGEMVPMLGAGDVVMSGLYLAAVRKHGLGMAKSVAALGLGYALVLSGLFVFEAPLPALPTLGLCFVVANPRTLKVPREERTKAVTGMLLLTALAVALALRA